MTMARSAAIEIEGARQLRASMKAAGIDLGDLAAAHAQVSGYVASRAKTVAPHRSGSLAATVRGNKAKTAAVVRAGSAAVPYAGPIHWGWPARHIAAHPFLTAVAAETEPTWTEIYFRAVNQIVDRIHGR
jgi:hypothetical protein